MIQGLPRAINAVSDAVKTVILSLRGAAGWLASLDSTSKVPTAQLGTGSASSSTYLRGDRTWATVSSSESSTLSAPMRDTISRASRFGSTAITRAAVVAFTICTAM